MIETRSTEGHWRIAWSPQGSVIEEVGRHHGDAGRLRLSKLWLDLAGIKGRVEDDKIRLLG
jgi:hypothetical protein